LKARDRSPLKTQKLARENRRDFGGKERINDLQNLAEFVP